MSDYSAESRRLAKKLAAQVSKKLAGSGRTLARDATTGRYVIRTLSENAPEPRRLSDPGVRTARPLRQKNAVTGDQSYRVVVRDSGDGTKNVTVRNVGVTKKVTVRNAGGTKNVTSKSGQASKKSSR